MDIKNRSHTYCCEDSDYVGEVVVSWIITHSCQEKCGYCISPNEQKEILLEKDHVLIQDKLIAGGLTKNRYIGGEPLLVKHLPRLVKEAYEKGIDTRISTNGILLTLEKFNLVKDYVNSFALPFESMDENLNRNIRKSRNHLVVITKRIQMIKAYSKIGVLINTCVHKENISGLLELGRHLQSLKIDHWKLRKFYFETGRGAVPNQNRFKISDEEFLEKVDFLKRKFPNLKIDGRMPSRLEKRLMISPQGDLYRMTGKEEEHVVYGNMLYDDINIKTIFLKDRCN